MHQELGTSKGLPPRPFVAPARYRNVEPICKLIGATIAFTLAGK